MRCLNRFNDRATDLAALAAGWLLMSFATAGHAQDALPADPALSLVYLSSEAQQDLMQKVGAPTLAAAQRSLLGDAAPSAEAATPRWDTAETLGTADLVYQVSDSISQTLRSQIASNIAAHDPQAAPRIRDALASDRVWRSFQQLLEDNGLDGHNLADVMTSYFVGSWEVVHDTVARPTEQHAAREQIARSLGSSPEILLMSNIQKQRSAETLGIMAAATQYGRRELQRQNDQIGLITLQAAVRDTLRGQGIDMDRLSLTNRGFVLDP